MAEPHPLPGTEPPRRTRPAYAPTDAEVAAFVGSNASYYRRQWADALNGEGGGTGFNWLAFLFVGLWLPYRRLYGHAFLVYGLFFACDVVSSMVAAARLGGRRGGGSGLDCFQLVLAVVVAVVVGVCANGWYLARLRSAVAESRARGRGEAEHLRTLARCGGTDLLAMFVFPVASIAIAVLVHILFFGASDF